MEERFSRYAAATIAGLFAAITIRYSSFVGVIADSSGYISQAHRWLDGQLFGALALVHLPSWPNPWLEVPLGYRLGNIAGTDVFVYPPGLPLMIAAAIGLGGELAGHVVAPLLGGAAVWATGELAHRLGGPVARVLAAALMATSAIALSMSVTAMSDVPTVGLWSVALVLALRGHRSSSLASGLLVAMAILTRPNLAPLAVIPVGLLVWSQSSGRIVSGLTFAAAASIGPLTLLATQGMLYESYLASGYLGIAQAFSFANVASNVASYPRWYFQTHTPAIVLAFVAPFLLWHVRDGPRQRRAFTLAVILLVFSVAVYAAYLPYTPFPEWQYLRFMLPAFPPLYALTAAVISKGIDRLPRRGQWPGLVILAVLLAGLQARSAHEMLFTRLWQMNKPVLLAVSYLDAALPPNAMVMTLFHSGSVRDATGRTILRPDLIAPQQLDHVVGLVGQFGYDLYVLMDEELERPGFNALWAPHTKLLNLDGRPRAKIGANGRLSLYRASDVHHPAADQSWPVDIVQ